MLRYLRFQICYKQTMNKLFTQKNIDPYQMNLPSNQNLHTQELMMETLRQFGSQITTQNIKELQLKLQMDQHSPDYQQIKYLLQTLLSYPSTKLAQLHRQSNKLGRFDLIKVQNRLNALNPVQDPMIDKLQYCPCCGFKKQDQELKICPDHFQDISNIGISTYLYFQTIINLAVLLTIAFFVFSIFALTTNIISSGKVTDANTLQKAKVSSNSDIILLSLGSKIYLSSEYLWQLITQAWVGVFLVVVWFGVFVALQFLQQKQCNRVEEQCKSAADYSIIIEGIPTNLKKQDLDKQFKDYVDQLKQVNTTLEEKYFQNFKVEKLNIARPFFYEVPKNHTQRLQGIYQTIENSQKQLADLILQRRQSNTFKTQKQMREKIAEKYLQTIKDKEKEYNQIIQQVKKTYEKQNKLITTTGFVTLDSNVSKKLILLKNQSGVLNKIRSFLTCFVWNQQFVFRAEDQSFKIHISQASQPEDIIWANIGLQKIQILKRRFLTFLVTLIILGISFVITYGLSTVQNDNRSNRYLSIIISLVISFFNFVILQALCYLTLYERDFTSTKRQTSLAVKAILAQVINSILIPILVNRFIKNKDLIYQKNGLAEDIFILAITNAMVSPIAKIFDLNYLMIRIIAWYKSLPDNKLFSDQLEMNKYFELIEFQHGYQYVYLINLYLFNCFFISLQPIIVLFAILGYFIMYWAQKYSLFHRCRRPVPGTKILNDVLVQFIYAGPLFYSLGSLVFINLLPQSLFSIELNQTLVANLIAIGISLLILLLPYSLIYECIMSKNEKQLQKFQQNRIYLPSQYDRLNPQTADQAFNQYMSFINKKKDQIDQESKQIKNKILQVFDHQGKHNFDKKIDNPNPILQIFRGKHANEINRILRPQIQHLNPNLIKMHLLPEEANPIAPYLVRSCIKNQRVNPGFSFSRIISDDAKLGFTQMPRRNFLPTSSFVQQKKNRMQQQKHSELKLNENDQKLMPSLVDIIIPSNNKISSIDPQKQYFGMKETNPIKNPLFNLYQNPYNPVLMQTFRMMDNKINMTKSVLPKKGNQFSSSIRNLQELQIKKTSKSQLKSKKQSNFK